MNAATERVRAIARRVTVAADELAPLRAALLAGSGARGDADGYSDVDLLLYADELPPATSLDELRVAVGGERPIPIAPHALQFWVDGVAVQVAYETVSGMEQQLDTALERLEEIVDTPNQKLLSGLLEGVPLAGEELLGGWRVRAAAYPEELRRRLIEHHWRVFPLWFYADAIAARDAELWRLDILLNGSFDLLGVLAGLNRVYYARFELKRLRALVAKLVLAPADLAERLESLVRLPPADAAAELGRLVVETRELVHHELPELELPLPRPPGSRFESWLDELDGPPVD